MTIEYRGDTSYLHAVNILRGVLALAVLLWHYPGLLLQQDSLTRESLPLYSIFQIFYTRGYDAVPVFWMLSGLVLSATYRTRLVGVGFTNFLIARFARLYPLHLVTLLVVAFLKVAGERAQVWPTDLRHFLLNLFFAQYWGFEDGFSFNGPSWSVSIEVPIYIFSGLVLFRFQGTKRLVVLGCLLICLVSLAAFNYPLGELLHIKNEFFRCAVFFCGGVAADALCGSGNKLRPSLMVFGAATLLVYLSLDRGNWLFGTSFLTCCLAHSASQLKSADFLRQVRLFGDLTYSVFLWHVPIQVIIRSILIRTGTEDSNFYSLWMLAAYLATTYLVGFFSFHAIEQPVRRWIVRRYVV